jgi:XRE family transcriptional regulator, aerobic/anaerobic benzoate catabolism transcriptional regulator
LGSMLAADLRISFIELDAEIEKDAGMPLGEIFSLYGQAGYRAIERRLLERVLNEHSRAILSVGGGVVSEKETYDYLLSHCYTIWIKARPEEYMARVTAQGDFRVMGGSDQAMEELRRILEAREPLYRKADLVLDTAGNTVEQSFAKLKDALASAEDRTAEKP